jgi:hypothetical protein
VFKEPFIYADNILSTIISTRELGDGVVVHQTKRVGYEDIEFIATDGKIFAHASSIIMALIDLRFKKSDRDTSWLKDKKLTDKLSFDDSVLAYRLITGACSGGVEGFLKNHKKQEKYQIAEIIEFTRGQYGNETFKEFFGAVK